MPLIVCVKASGSPEASLKAFLSLEAQESLVSLVETRKIYLSLLSLLPLMRKKREHEAKVGVVSRPRFLQSTTKANHDPDLGKKPKTP